MNPIVASLAAPVFWITDICLTLFSWSLDILLTPLAAVYRLVTWPVRAASWIWGEFQVKLPTYLSLSQSHTPGPRLNPSGFSKMLTNTPPPP